MDELQNKIKGLGQELALFQTRYFKEKAYLDTQLNELNKRVEILDTLVGNLQVRLVVEEKKPVEKVVERVEIKAEVAPEKSWWEKIMK